MLKKSNILNNFRRDLKNLENLEKKAILQRFFKTGKDQYGEGDVFLGITVPKQRNLIKSYIDLNLNELEILLNSKIHEERLSALLILVEKYKKTVKQKLLNDQTAIYEFYLKNAKNNNINNWDLVDLSAPQIVGHYLSDKNKTILHQLILEKNLWQRRIGMLATFYFIKQNEFAETLTLAKKLLNDQEDLMHKATGWMLREVGKRDFATLEQFLLQHYKIMPRTMLRYAIEKFPEKRRLEFLKGEI